MPFLGERQVCKSLCSRRDTRSFLLTLFIELIINLINEAHYYEFNQLVRRFLNSNMIFENKIKYGSLYFRK